MARRSTSGEAKPAGRARSRARKAPGEGGPVAAAEVAGDASLRDTVRTLEATVARLAGISGDLEKSVGEVPRAADFEAFSEHLYELARQSPQIVERLGEATNSAGEVRDSVERLGGLVDALESVHEGLGEALLRLPRAEDYEPLTTPLREFARAAPALVESLREIPALSRGLGEGLRTLEEAASRPPPGSHHFTGTAPPGFGARLEEVARHLESAGKVLRDALATLPRTSEYAPLAAQLRELATVSPSLMEWLSEVPKVTEPLAASVASLREAGDVLDAARQEVLACAHEARETEGLVEASVPSKKSGLTRRGPRA